MSDPSFTGFSIGFPHSATILTGLPQSTLLTYLATAQAALANLMVGGMPVSVSYGEKSVTYRQTDVSMLTMWIYLLQLQLGLARPRRALVPIFR